MNIFKYIHILLIIFFSQQMFADYISPGNNRYFTLDSLVTYSNGSVTTNDTSYFINNSVTISTTDTLFLKKGNEIIFTDVTGTVELRINGALLAYGSVEDSIIFTSKDKNYGDYYGLYYRDTTTGSDFQLMYCRIEYATRAIDIYNADAEIRNCLIQHTSESAIDLGSSNSIICDNKIHHNKQRAITMTVNSSPILENNIFTENNFENSSPFTIISIGLQGMNSPEIRNNVIIGRYEMSGGIAIWNNSNAMIENNRIENCGYGILCYQFDANPLIKGNTILNNTIHPDTLNWGFAIACNGSNMPVVTGNIMEGNYYGVAIINGAQPNCGNLNNTDTTDDGRNQFIGNGIGSNLYELYNNNSLPILAENNWWGTSNPDSIEARIRHQPDNPSFGLVDYDPFITADPVYMKHDDDNYPAQLQIFPAFPNPFNPLTHISFFLPKKEKVAITIYDVGGRQVKKLINEQLLNGNHSFQWNGTNEVNEPVGSGIYFYQIKTNLENKSGKLILLQ